jgi:type I restriction enzyme M protein
VELDGGQHAGTRQSLHDEERLRYLNRDGIQVLRFWNNDVLAETEAVLEVIWKTLIPPHPSPLPQGRGNARKIHS